MGNTKIRHARFDTELETFSATRNVSLRSPTGTRARRRAIAASVIVAAAMAAMGTSPQAGATPTITWTGTSSQLWSNSANWSPSIRVAATTIPVST